MTAAPQPPDDPSIADAEDLWRRVHPDHWVLDKNVGAMRISSAAFTNQTNQLAMSVEIASMCASPASALEGHEDHGLAAFSAGHARHQCGQGVVPAPEQDNPAHAHVTGDKPKPVKRCLQRGASIVQEPSKNAE